MKSVQVHVVVFMLALLCTHAYGADFRGAQWGMSAEDILKSEDKTPTRQDASMIVYDGEDIAGIKMDIVYFFEENKLFMAKYFAAYKDVFNASDNFFELNKVLESKYGKPKLKIDKPSYVTSLEGHLNSMRASGRGGFSATWKTKDVEISLQLVAKETDFFTLSIFYESQKYKYLKEKRDKGELSKKGAKL